MISFKGRLDIALGEEQGMVMAVQTAQIAVRQKEDRTDLLLAVYKGGFYESLDFEHSLLS
jgi:hypothetical protein